MRVGLVVSTALVALIACDEPKPPERAATVGASASTPSAPTATEPPGGHPIASEVAFDLVLAGDGALLAWGAPDERVKVQRLGRDGDAVGEVHAIRQSYGKVNELEAQNAGDRIALVWMATKAGEAELATTSVDVTTNEAEPPQRLGKTELRALGKRGHVALGVRASGTLTALHQGLRSRCQDSEPAECSTFSMSALPYRDERPPRPRLVMETPCDLAVVGITMLADHWHYALCEMKNGEPLTTVFTIRPDPAYAQARELLRGCEPNGMTTVDDELWITAVCKGQRTAWRLRGIEAGSSALDISGSSLHCDDGHPVIQTGVHGPTYPLLGPRAQLAPLLPSRIAPIGARAVWTGEVLLVARAEGSAVTLTKHRCQGALLLQR